MARADRDSSGPDDQRRSDGHHGGRRLGSGQPTRQRGGQHRRWRRVPADDGHLRGPGGALRPDRTVGIDLRDDWPAALQAAGFDTAEPTVWLAEGVLIGWLPPQAEARLLDQVTRLSAAASRFAADFGTVAGRSETAQLQNRLITERRREHGLEPDIAGLARQ